MMREAIEQRAGQTLIAEDARPFLEWKIGCYDRRPVPAPPFSCPEQRSTSETLMHDSLSPAGLIVTCYLTKIPANSRRSTVNSCAGGPSGPAANADITTPYAGVRTR
jgi:hypothetical protein